MTEVIYPLENGESVRVDLRSPFLAAALGWLWPGAGHLYQRRYAKGMLFMVCVLSTYVFGLGIGHGRVVYASLKPEGTTYRWQYLLQLQVGIPAFPAILQNFKTRNSGDPYFVLCERYPADYGGNQNLEKDALKRRLRFQRIPPNQAKVERALKDGFMAPPAGTFTEDRNDVVGQWVFELKHLFDLGTYYTVIAGILNLLVVYDAFVGPAIFAPVKKQ